MEQVGGSFGFQDKICFLSIIAVYQDGPVGIVSADGRFDFETGREFEEQLYVRIIVQRLGEGAFHRAAVIDDVVIYAVCDSNGISIQVRN